MKTPTKRLIIGLAGAGVIHLSILTCLNYAIFDGTYHGRSIGYHLFIKARLIKEFPLIKPAATVQYTNDWGEAGMGPLNEINYDSSAPLDELVQQIDRFSGREDIIPRRTIIKRNST